VALWANQLSKQQGDITRTAPYVEHLHSSHDAGIAQHPLCGRIEQPSLFLQAIRFRIGVTEEISALGNGHIAHHCCSPALAARVHG